MNLYLSAEAIYLEVQDSYGLCEWLIIKREHMLNLELLYFFIQYVHFKRWWSWSKDLSRQFTQEREGKVLHWYNMFIILLVFYSCGWYLALAQSDYHDCVFNPSYQGCANYMLQDEKIEPMLNDICTTRSNLVGNRIVCINS